MIDETSRMGFGVVTRWTCDGCKAQRTILHGRVELDGRHYCASCGAIVYERAKREPDSHLLCVALCFDKEEIRDLTAEEQIELLSITREQLDQAYQRERVLVRLAVAEHALDCGCEVCARLDASEPARLIVDRRFLRVDSSREDVMIAAETFAPRVREDAIRSYRDGGGARCDAVHFFADPEGLVRAARCLRRAGHNKDHRGIRAVWTDDRDPRRLPAGFVTREVN